MTRSPQAGSVLIREPGVSAQPPTPKRTCPDAQRDPRMAHRGVGVVGGNSGFERQHDGAVNHASCTSRQLWRGRIGMPSSGESATRVSSVCTRVTVDESVCHVNASEACVLHVFSPVIPVLRNQPFVLMNPFVLLTVGFPFPERRLFSKFSISHCSRHSLALCARAIWLMTLLLDAIQQAEAILLTALRQLIHCEVMETRTAPVHGLQL
ncbi:unnamed protein product [Pleuronectes platessa]|uniref:Uncharacterized protein n=1 Tax=Pleuronectes platessa TaxID=8262 RepID=A0A9N7YG82_PLEPL|nr:unnamed protein product [Pleuronectes platessa]